ncbi:MAG: hypothetical protein Q9219_003198 [cf. Caloplaca sp. 3 TL-2023]
MEFHTCHPATERPHETTFPLMKLPLEVLSDPLPPSEDFYENITHLGSILSTLFDENRTAGTNWDLHLDENRTDANNTLSLLLVDKQISAEATHVLYHDITFDVCVQKDPHTWDTFIAFGANRPTRFLSCADIPPSYAAFARIRHLRLALHAPCPLFLLDQKEDHAEMVLITRFARRLCSGLPNLRSLLVQLRCWNVEDEHLCKCERLPRWYDPFEENSDVFRPSGRLPFRCSWETECSWWKEQSWMARTIMHDYLTLMAVGYVERFALI